MKCAFVFHSAITAVGGCGVYMLIENFLVMLLDDAGHVGHTAVTHFDIIAVEQFVHDVGLRKMFIQQALE